MKKMNRGTAKTAKSILFALLGAMIALVLVLSLLSTGTVTKNRVNDCYDVVGNVTVTLADGTSRAQTECRFTLDAITHAETLAFYVSHHDVAVYVDGECVYSLTAPHGSVFTTGGNAWVLVPIYESDVGKEVRVLLTPLYENYETEIPEFLIGSEHAVHMATLHRALPALVLSLCVAFAGFLLICLAVYHSAKGLFTGRLYALGLMAVSAGVWRISYDRVAYLLLPDQSVMVYTLSILSLMVVALSMLNSLGTDERGEKFIRVCSCAYCALYIAQLAMQAFGVADLRQTLKLIHMTILLSAGLFVAGAVLQWVKPKEHRSGRGNYGWILGVGVVIDLLLYYFGKSSMNIVFTLLAILCYSVCEGIGLLFTYIEQKNALEEMQINLMLSRTTTMMSQIRSHFVFNILNAISGMCKYDPEKADDTIVRFARYLRSNIDIMENDKNIPFSTDLKQLEDYVILEQVRFGDKIEFYTDIETEDFFIPPLILQPVVENAIKHGVSKKLGNGTIILRTRDNGDHITITVEDDGVGFDVTQPEKAQSVGIRNIRFRLEHLVHGTLQIESRVGEGTTVTITIPKEVR